MERAFGPAAPPCILSMKLYERELGSWPACINEVRDYTGIEHGYCGHALLCSRGLCGSSASGGLVRGAMPGVDRVPQRGFQRKGYK